MGLLMRGLGALLANAVSFWLASYYIPGFSLPADPQTIFTVAAILTALNIVVKPILKLILGPIIVLTLGVGLLIVNAVLLYILDIATPALTIETIVALGMATLLFSIVNLILAHRT